MTTSITALTATPANFNRVTAERAVVSEEVLARPNASNRRDSSERVIEGELLRDLSRADFSFDDIVGVQTGIDFDPRFTSTVAVQVAVASNDAVAAYVSNGSVFNGVQCQVDTFA